MAVVKEHSRHDNHADRDFALTDVDVSRALPHSAAGFFVSQDQNGQRHHGKAPHNAECVQSCQREYVSFSDECNSYQLQDYDQIDDAVAGSKTRVRLLKCCR